MVVIIVLIFVCFWHNLYLILNTYISNAMKSSNSIIGNIWFISLLIINISIVIFIYMFYYYKSMEKGDSGNEGNKGFDGQPGEPCSIKSNSNSCIA